MVRTGKTQLTKAATTIQEALPREQAAAAHDRLPPWLQSPQAGADC